MMYLSLRSEKEIFGIRKGAFDCVCLLSSCSSFVLNYSRCMKKSHFNAVTFGRRVVCPFMFKKFERAQIEEGVRWFYYTHKRS